MGLLDDLTTLADSADVFARQDRKKAARNLANAEVFLVLDAGEMCRVQPLHWLLHMRSPGKSFADSKRSNVSLTAVARDLSAVGYRRIRPGDAGFEAAWDALLMACAALGTAPSRRSSGPDWTGRSFFMRSDGAPTRATVLAAMARIAAGEASEGFGPARSWFVRHPETGAFFPAKIVWGLASGKTGRDFNAHQARDGLRRLAFDVPGPDQKAADIAESPETLAQLPIGIEGAERQVTRNIKERDPAARRAAETWWRVQAGGNLVCQGCDLDFGRRYGPRGEGFMHFHHIEPLAKASGPRQIAGPQALVPLCPNCHAMVHRGEDLLSVEDLQKLVRDNADDEQRS